MKIQYLVPVKEKLFWMWSSWIILADKLQTKYRIWCNTYNILKDQFHVPFAPGCLSGFQFCPITVPGSVSSWGVGVLSWTNTKYYEGDCPCLETRPSTENKRTDRFTLTLSFHLLITVCQLSLFLHLKRDLLLILLQFISLLLQLLFTHT